MFPLDILELAEQVLTAARVRGWRIVTAESCTGGLVAGALTAIAGSSDVFERGFVTYANDAKTEMLGVLPVLISENGAVSSPVALAMAMGAIERSNADVAISITGVAGPGGGSDEKPVGLVIFGVAERTAKGGDEVGAYSTESRFGDLGSDRVREESVRRALRLLLNQVRISTPSETA